MYPFAPGSIANGSICMVEFAATANPSRELTKTYFHGMTAHFLLFSAVNDCAMLKVFIN